MYALDAISAASAIVSFVDFSIKLVARSGELYANSQLEEHAELDVVQRDLEKLLASIRSNRQTDQGLEDLVKACQDVGAQLRDALIKLQRPEGGHRAVRVGRSALLALKTMLGKERIKNLEMRLNNIRNEIQFKLIVLLSNRSAEFMSSFAITQQQLEELSFQASMNVSQVKEHHREQMDGMPDLERRIFSNIELQHDALEGVAMFINEQMQRQHFETIAEVRSVRDDVSAVHHQLDEYNENIRRQIRMGEQHARGIEAVARRIESSEQRLEQEKYNEKVRERNKRMWDSVNNLLHPPDRNGKPRRMTEGEWVGRRMAAGSILAVHFGMHAAKKMQGPDGSIQLPFKVPPMKPPKPDFAAIGKPFQDLGNKIQQIPKPDKSLIEKPIKNLGEQFQKINLQSTFSNLGRKGGSPTQNADSPEILTTSREIDDCAKDSIEISVDEAPLIQLIDLEPEEEKRPPLPARPRLTDPVR
ncbi:MAG: hypothetical protein M1820_001930 [Bogoriella megaspora]|nr:MAG: hypothetical protein M1820_001930 [Bogoriella megaspora]